VEEPRPFRHSIEPLGIEPVWKLINAVPDRYRAMIVLGAGTGVRISEALGLTNERVDWLPRTVTIDRQLLRIRSGSSPEFGKLKDRNNRPRTIPLPLSWWRSFQDTSADLD
jgi:integrase